MLLRWLDGCRDFLDSFKYSLDKERCQYRYNYQTDKFYSAKIFVFFSLRNNSLWSKLLYLKFQDRIWVICWPFSLLNNFWLYKYKFKSFCKMCWPSVIYVDYETYFRGKCITCNILYHCILSHILTFCCIFLKAKRCKRKLRGSDDTTITLHHER